MVSPFVYRCIAVQLQVQARDGLIPVEPFAVANERELGVDQ
jgi:hypothetical protein